MKKTTLRTLLGFALFFPILIFGQANDDFANAEAVTCAGTYTGTTAAATVDENDAPDGFGTVMDSPNVWYSYTGSGTPETITLNLCNSAYDTSVLVYTGSSGNLTLVIANDDDNTCGALLTTRSRVSFQSDGTSTYYITIEGYLQATGAYTMDVTCDSVTPPAVANQACDTALAINVDGSLTDSDNSFGDISPTQTTCDLFGSIQDVWFSFVAGSATVDCTVTNGTMTSANFATYSGDCTALTQIGCTSNSTTTAKQSLTGLTAGDTYYVQVWSNGSEQGTFSIGLSDPSLCMPVATFEKISNCPVDSDFSVTADVTEFASATTVTVSDNQGNTQTISAPALVTFGPYTSGTSVIVTVTNDQSPSCALISPTQTSGLCPQANDECDNAVTIACGDTLTSQTTTGATGGTDTSCVGTIGDDVWYTFVGTGDVYTLTATSSNGEGPQVEVYESTDGTCAGFSVGAGCFAGAGTGDTVASVLFVTTVGTTYYTHVGNYINGFGAVDFDLTLTCEAPPTAPANDECSGAYALTVNSDSSCGSVTAGTVYGATPSGVDEAACGGTPDDDVWFSFVATADSHAISLNNIVGTNTDLYHSLWSGDCSGLTLVPNSCTDANNSLPTGLNVGETYYIRVYSYTNVGLQDITFDVCVSAAPTAPDNDDCLGAFAVTVNPDASCASVTSGTVYGATASGVDEAACGGTPDDDVWFSFVATETAHSVGLSNVAGSTTDLYHSLWSGDCGGLTLVPGTCSDGDNGVVTGLTVGDTYYIRVYSYTATALQTTTFDVCVGTLPPPPANDECDNAVALTVGNSITAFPVEGTTSSALPTSGLTFACQTNRTNDVWYTVEVPVSGLLTLETAGAPGTIMTDSVLSVFSGTCGALTEIGCDDDSGDDGNFSKVVLSGLNAGDILYVGVWRYGTGNDGTFNISAYDTTLATTSFDNASFAYYPNPVNDVLNLSYSKNITAVAVYNLLGQEVVSKALNSSLSQIDMSHLSAGTYLVKVTANNQVKTVKVVKQ